MTNQEMVARLDRSLALTRSVRDALASAPPPSHIIDVTPGQSVQAVLDGAPVGATLRLAPGTYEGAVVIAKSVHLIPLNPPANGQATRDASVWLTSRAEETLFIGNEADDVSLVGIGLKNEDANYQWATVCGSRVVFDRCTGLGDPTHGQHRGWQLDGKEMRLTNCFADDVFLVGRESSVIASWQDCDGLLVENCYLRGGAETIMFGGADSDDADAVPQNIHISGCTLTKNPAWYAMGAQLKNAFELKCARQVVMSDCLCEYAGVAEGQGAYLLVLTVRNQDGHAPWSTIQDVTIERSVFRHGGGGINILGSDDQYPSETMTNVTIRDCSFTQLNPQGLWSQGGSYGSGRCLMFQRAPHAITLDGITMDGENMGALGYFPVPGQQPTGLVLRNWKYCDTEYGWKIEDGGMDTPPAHANISALMPDLVYEITANDPGASIPAVWRA